MGETEKSVVHCVVTKFGTKVTNNDPRQWLMGLQAAYRNYESCRQRSIGFGALDTKPSGRDPKDTECTSSRVRLCSRQISLTTTDEYDPI